MTTAHTHQPWRVVPELSAACQPPIDDTEATLSPTHLPSSPIELSLKSPNSPFLLPHPRISSRLSFLESGAMICLYQDTLNIVGTQQILQNESPTQLSLAPRGVIITSMSAICCPGLFFPVSSAGGGGGARSVLRSLRPRPGTRPPTAPEDRGPVHYKACKFPHRIQSAQSSDPSPKSCVSISAIYSCPRSEGG